MTDYIQEIQKQLISKFGFEKGENGCPKNVPDGAYPMIIDKKLDLICIIKGKIWCCNFIGDREGLKKFQLEAALKYNGK